LRRTRRRAAWNRFGLVRWDIRQGGTSAASPMRAYSTIAAVTSQGPTSDQLTDGSYPNKATIGTSSATPLYALLL